MEAEFKVGDKVEVLFSNNGAPARYDGCIGEVIDIEGPEVFSVKMHDGSDWVYDAKELRLVADSISAVDPEASSSMAMTKEEYFQLQQELCERMIAITKAKNADYTGVNADPFANFRVVEEAGIISTEKGFLTRMMDKMCRINSFVDKGVLEVKDESVEDTLLDLANYCHLFLGYIKSKKKQAR